MSPRDGEGGASQEGRTFPARRFLSPALYALLGALLVFSPLHWPCPVAKVFGLPCPTCGMTRATRLALHGALADATAMHPLVWIVVPWLAMLFVLEARGYVQAGTWGGSKRALPRSGAVTLAIAVMLFVLWIARFCGAFGGPVPVV